jgi:hypothetical protein
MMVRLYCYTFSIESFHSVFGQVLIKHWEYFLRHVVYSDLVELDQFRVYASHVFLDNVMQLGRKLNASGSSTDDGKIKELFALLVRRCGKGCGFKAGQNSIPDSARVTDIF